MTCQPRVQQLVGRSVKLTVIDDGRHDVTGLDGQVGGLFRVPAPLARLAGLSDVIKSGQLMLSAYEVRSTHCLRTTGGLAFDTQLPTQRPSLVLVLADHECLSVEGAVLVRPTGRAGARRGARHRAYGGVSAPVQGA